MVTGNISISLTFICGFFLTHHELPYFIKGREFLHLGGGDSGLIGRILLPEFLNYVASGSVILRSAHTVFMCFVWI